MLVLDSINKSITASLSSAVSTSNPSFVTAYSDDNGTTFIEGSSDGALNGTNQVTLVSSPAASTRRLIKTINVVNTDTAPIILTIYLNNNGTLRVIYKATLSVDDVWTTDGVTDSNGNFKGIGFPGYSGYSGYSGAVGSTGISGYSGASGLSGYSGATGLQGISGYSGFSGISPSTGKAIAMAMIFGF